MPSLAPGWLLAAVPEGLLLVGPDTDVEVELDARAAELERAAATLARDADAAALVRHCRLDAADGQELVRRLIDGGALAYAGAHQPRRLQLAAAVLAAYEGVPIGSRVWTADELLVLPQRLSGRPLRRALRAFIAGFRSHLRLRGYARLAVCRRRTLWGDLPPDALAERALARARSLDAEAIHVVDLRDGSVASAAVEEVGRIGAEAPHRLGPIAGVSSAEADLRRPRIFLASARYAQPNLRFPGRARDLGSGLGETPEHAELVARAEAIEHYAAGDVAAHELCRAAEGELEGAVAPDALWRYGARQYSERYADERYESGERLLWTAAQSLDGSRRWVPAESVFFPFADVERTGRLPPASSSGMAAHTDPAAAREAAFAELVERDAFMWTWVQRVARERLDPRGADPRTLAIVRALEARGHAVEFVNLTLDTWPVVLCAVFDDDALSMAAACHREPVRAAARSLLEASISALWRLERDGGASITPEQVRTPADHRDLYRCPQGVEAAGFLLSSPDRIGFDDVACAEGPVEELVAVIGEPVAVDLGSPATRPFHVVRALVPGIVPISFGYDREPLGIPRLAQPKTLADGRRVGACLQLADVEPLVPHPLP